MIQFSDLISVTGLQKLEISDLEKGIYLIRVDGPGVEETIKYVRK
jgi:hypothetical protein